MVAAHRNSIASEVTISAMNVYNEDSIGRRIAWARKNVDWVDSAGVRHMGMTGHQLGRRLVTQGTVTGVRNVYVSQLENNHASPSLPMLKKIAEVTGVTVGFLLMETDYPYRGKPEAEPEAVYFSEEADAAAKLIDDVLDPHRRAEMLSVLRALAQYGAPQAAQNAPAGKPAAGEVDRAVAPAAGGGNAFARRLIDSERVQQRASV